MHPTGSGTTRYTFDIFADYHQIYLEDCGASAARTALDSRDPQARADEISAWVDALLSKEAHARHLGIADGTLCLLTARNDTVPLELEIRVLPPEPDPHERVGWDEIVEASLDLPSGCLEVAGLSDELGLPHIDMAPGRYRARVYYGGVYTVSADKLDGKDHYRVVLWPDPTPVDPPVILHAQGTGSW